MTTIKKKITTETEVVEDYICNKCGKSLWDSKYSEYAGMTEKFAEGDCFGQFYGYGSMYLFSLCKDCTKELFDTFITPPEPL